MTEDIAVQVGRNLAAARAAAGLSQTEVAQRVGSNRTYISRLERGLANPHVSIIARVLHVCGFVARWEVTPLRHSGNTESEGSEKSSASEVASEPET